jgi:hypothetical protein
VTSHEAAGRPVRSHDTSTPRWTSSVMASAMRSCRGCLKECSVRLLGEATATQRHGRRAGWRSGYCRGACRLSDRRLIHHLTRRRSSRPAASSCRAVRRLAPGRLIWRLAGPIALKARRSAVRGSRLRGSRAEVGLVRLRGGRRRTREYVAGDQPHPPWIDACRGEHRLDGLSAASRPNSWPAGAHGSGR